MCRIISMQALKRPPYQLLEGDFIRADCRTLSHESSTAKQKQQHAPPKLSASAATAIPVTLPWRVLKKDEPLDWTNCVCRIMTNKRGTWQAARNK